MVRRWLGGGYGVGQNLHAASRDNALLTTALYTCFQLCMSGKKGQLLGLPTVFGV